MFNKYQTQPQSLDHISLVEFVAKHNIKNHKKISIVKLSIGCHLIYIKTLKIIIKNYCYCSNFFVKYKKIWKKIVLHGMKYINSKNDVKETPKNIVHNFNQNGDCNNEWHNL
jgi:hypothetical protein